MPKEIKKKNYHKNKSNNIQYIFCLFENKKTINLNDLANNCNNDSQLNSDDYNYFNFSVKSNGAKEIILDNIKYQIQADIDQNIEIKLYNSKSGMNFFNEDDSITINYNTIHRDIDWTINKIPKFKEENEDEINFHEENKIVFTLSEFEIIYPCHDVLEYFENSIGSFQEDDFILEFFWKDNNIYLKKITYQLND
jgi:hypothetical protein